MGQNDELMNQAIKKSGESTCLTQKLFVDTQKLEDIRCIPIQEKTIDSIIKKLELLKNQKSNWIAILFNIDVALGGACASNLLSIGNLTVINIWVGFVTFGCLFLVVLGVLLTAHFLTKKYTQENIQDLENELETLKNAKKKEDLQ